MKDFKRDNLYFSLCGLNCGLCTMHLGNHCPGCGCSEHHACPIAKCSMEHDDVQYCFQCDEFPCGKYDDAGEYDSFITHRNRLKDFEKAREIGIEAYTREQIEKVKTLNYLLANYNAGRQKTFFSLAVNILDIQDIRSVMEHLNTNSDIAGLPIKEKAAYAVKQFQDEGDKQGLRMKLNKKPKVKKG